MKSCEGKIKCFSSKLCYTFSAFFSANLLIFISLNNNNFLWLILDFILSVYILYFPSFYYKFSCFLGTASSKFPHFPSFQFHTIVYHISNLSFSFFFALGNFPKLLFRCGSSISHIPCHILTPWHVPSTHWRQFCSSSTTLDVWECVWWILMSETTHN